MYKSLFQKLKLNTNNPMLSFKGPSLEEQHQYWLSLSIAYRDEESLFVWFIVNHKFLKF